MTDRPPTPSRTTVVFLLFPGITQLDFTGPAQALARMPGSQMVTAATSAEPIRTDSGFSILPTHEFDQCPQADLLCVPGGHGVAEALGDDRLIEFIRRQANQARWITSVCTGAFLLGKAGLLQGKRATTHWAYTQLLPLVGATHSAGRIIEDGHVISCGGVTAGLDFALKLIAHIHGDRVAKAVQLALEYDPAPPFKGGHPDHAAPDLTTGLRQNFYGAAAARIEQALNA